MDFGLFNSVRIVKDGGNFYNPDARKARGSQDPTGMRLAEITNKGKGEPVENISIPRLGMTPD